MAGPETKRVVLVVEDDDDIREVVCELLADEGYEVLCVASVEEARGVIGSTPPDVMLLDLNIKGAEERGTDLLASLDGERLSGPPTILISAARDAPEVARTYGIMHLRKPFDLEQLLEALKTAIERDLRPHGSPT